MNTKIKLFKKLIAFTLIIMMCVSAVPVSFADDLPFSVVSSVDGDTLTVTISSISSFTYMSFSGEIQGVPENAECTAMNKGADFPILKEISFQTLKLLNFLLILNLFAMKQ